MRSIAVSEVGHVRDHNEDAVYVNDELGLWLVADGMGGHAAGEVASRLAIDTIVTEVDMGTALTDALQRAHRVIITAASENPAQRGMGTTVVAVYQENKDFKLAWSGDSRIYAWSSEEPFRQLTHDQSLVGDMVSKGLLSEEEAQNHPYKNLISQALGMTNIPKLSLGEISYSPKGAGGLMLCSDGVSDMLNHETLAKIVTSGESLESRAENLRQAVNNSIASDNFSFVLIGNQA